MEIRVPVKVLQDLECRLFEAAGLTHEDAKLTAEVLIDADLRGIYTHGSFRVPVYLDRLRDGSVHARPNTRIVTDRLATAVLDGDHGLGQVSGVTAMNLAIEKARTCGTGLVTVVNGHHYGAGAYFANQAAKANMIGLALCNTKPLMPPTGGKRPLIGTNPVAIGIPAAKNPPFILDIALSQVAHGRIRVARMKGEPIPDGWALDKDGNPTNDPEKGMFGLLLPAGGHKGYGLAMAVDILTGMLCGGGWSIDVKPMDSTKEHQNSAQLYAAINIEAFRDLDGFKQEMDEYFKLIKECPRQPGVEDVYYPGERAVQRCRQNLELGIPMQEKLVEQIRIRAEALGVKATF